jgi:hypothetical protein
MALRVARRAQPQQVLGPVNIAPLEFGRCYPQESCDAYQVGFRDVDESFLLATIRATALALETQTL